MPVLSFLIWAGIEQGWSGGGEGKRERKRGSGAPGGQEGRREQSEAGRQWGGAGNLKHLPTCEHEAPPAGHAQLGKAFKAGDLHDGLTSPRSGSQMGTRMWSPALCLALPSIPILIT